ncbi:MAG: tyrosine-type recombinase/integrase [Candidatus Micrarchaeaceae archaeon]
MKRIFISDCEGPISKNDNAFELATNFIPNGDSFFANISKYDDVLADVLKKPGYCAGGTLKLILPFFKAYGVTDKQMEDFSANNIVLIANSQTTLQHIKSFLSGIYTYARTHGHFDGANPVTGVKLPKASPPAETYAYSLEEERLMMKAVSSPKARLALAVASWTGVDKGELEGLRWEDRKGADFYITRKIWEGNEKDPKADKRKAPIPIIPHLKKMMDAYWKGVGSPPEGWIFTASRGEKPIRMDNLAKREIIPELKKAGLDWHGWHAFRRGLATNLREMGVPDDILQRILRHSDVATTQRHYAKTLPKSVRKAMAKFDRKLKAG